jgi:hypothetical protein
MYCSHRAEHFGAGTIDQSSLVMPVPLISWNLLVEALQSECFCHFSPEIPSSNCPSRSLLQMSRHLRSRPAESGAIEGTCTILSQTIVRLVSRLWALRRGRGHTVTLVR